MYGQPNPAISNIDKLIQFTIRVGDPVHVIITGKLTQLTMYV